MLDEPLESLPQRRAQAILLYNDGMSATEIAHTLERHVNTIYAYLTAFDQHGLPGVCQQGKRGAPARLSPAQCRTICRIADQSQGTLFLDEIGDLPLDAQRTLLHILEENHLIRVGGGVSVPIDVRVIAATNRNLRKAVQEGTFREDLFYRLRVFLLVLPPLRNRREDIPILAAHFAAQFAEELQRPVPSLGDEVIAHLQEHDWPGNVRELEYLIQRAVVVCQGGVIQVEDVPLSVEDEDEEGALLLTASAVEQGTEDKDEKQQIVEALEATNWLIYGDRGAACLLGMNPERLRSRMRVYGLRRPKKSS